MIPFIGQRLKSDSSISEIYIKNTPKNKIDSRYCECFTVSKEKKLTRAAAKKTAKMPIKSVSVNQHRQLHPTIPTINRPIAMPNNKRDSHKQSIAEAAVFQKNRTTFSLVLFQ